jgi:hypothetical protein
MDRGSNKCSKQMAINHWELQHKSTWTIAVIRQEKRSISNIDTCEQELRYTCASKRELDLKK